MDPITLILAGIATWVMFHGKTWQRLILAAFLLVITAGFLYFLHSAGATFAVWIALGFGVLIVFYEFDLFQKIFSNFTNFSWFLGVLFLVWLGYNLYNGIPIY